MFFFKIQNATFYVFFMCHVKKNVKNVESIVHVFTFVHFEIVNGHFHCKTITHATLYIQHYIKTVYFWLKYNGLATV